MAVRATTRLATTLALGTALVTGCTDDDGGQVAQQSPSPSPSPLSTSPSPSPTATGGADSREWSTCVSTRASLQVSYPGGWTARDYPGGGCAYFDPEPFEVQRGTEASGMAVRLDVEAVEYERVRRAYVEDNDELMSHRETEVAGSPAVRVEDRDTQGPTAPKGRRLTYLADLGQEQTLVLTTNESDADDPERAREVLDLMAERLQRTG